jgi:hypothetical protein
MKKIKKMFAVIAGALLSLTPILATPITSLADEADVDYWYSWDYAAKEDVNTGIPITVTTDTAQGVINIGAEGMYADVDAAIDQMTEEQKAEDAELIESMKGMYFAQAYVWGSYFNTNDTFTLYLPFSGEYVEVVAFSPDSDEDEWEVVGHTSNSVTVKSNVDENFVCRLMILYRKAAAEDQFWFKPMKTQLNIAAEVAATSGKEAVAEVSGDFGLSYEIMLWLENHPNVTLKYTLSYKEKEYNIVIKGGQKLADPKIPWYGPEYLIGKFVK